jgi:O-antigen/teichoic acid export membrane protein
MSSLNVLTTVVSVLIVLSVSAERLVEIVKGLIPFLSKENEDADKERWRKLVLQVLAVVAGILTAFLAEPLLPDEVKKNLHLTTSSIVALGFLSSGGSGFWNGILGYLKGIKDIKQVQAADARTAVARGNAEVRAKLLQPKKAA